jgi:hypothetical protein
MFRKLALASGVCSVIKNTPSLMDHDMGVTGMLTEFAGNGDGTIIVIVRLVGELFSVPSIICNREPTYVYRVSAEAGAPLNKIARTRRTKQRFMDIMCGAGWSRGGSHAGALIIYLTHPLV